MANDPREALRKARVEFTRGLPGRLAKIRDALMGLQHRFDGKHAEQFHVTSHALSGMAATFDAHEMAEGAHLLAQLGRAWRNEGAVTAAGLAEGQRLLGLLDATVTAFLAKEEADSSEN